jgi:hypothetical protein
MIQRLRAYPSSQNVERYDYSFNINDCIVTRKTNYLMIIGNNFIKSVHPSLGTYYLTKGRLMCRPYIDQAFSMVRNSFTGNIVREMARFVFVISMILYRDHKVFLGPIKLSNFFVYPTEETTMELATLQGPLIFPLHGYKVIIVDMTVIYHVPTDTFINYPIPIPAYLQMYAMLFENIRCYICEKGTSYPPYIHIYDIHRNTNDQIVEQSQEIDFDVCNY